MNGILGQHLETWSKVEDALGLHVPVDCSDPVIQVAKDLPSIYSEPDVDGFVKVMPYRGRWLGYDGWQGHWLLQ